MVKFTAALSVSETKRGIQMIYIHTFWEAGIQTLWDGATLILKDQVDSLGLLLDLTFQVSIAQSIFHQTSFGVSAITLPE